jgi:hypothetical protein
MEFSYFPFSKIKFLQAEAKRSFRINFGRSQVDFHVVDAQLSNGGRRVERVAAAEGPVALFMQRKLLAFALELC